MPEQITLEVAVPDRQVVKATTTQVQLPLSTGYKGVLPGHAPMMAEIGTGVLTFDSDEGKKFLALDGGVVEILPDYVRVLATTAEFAPEIDAKRAMQALERANERLQLESLEVDVERARRAVQRAQSRLAATEAQSD